MKMCGSLTKILQENQRVFGVPSLIELFQLFQFGQITGKNPVQPRKRETAAAVNDRPTNGPTKGPTNKAKPRAIIRFGFQTRRLYQIVQIVRILLHSSSDCDRLLPVFLLFFPSSASPICPQTQRKSSGNLVTEF